MLKGTEMAGNSAQVGEDRGTLANWVSLEIAAELQAAVQGFTPRERRAGPAAPALGSKERAEAFLVQPPENWAMEEAAVGVGKCMGVTSVIDVLCNPGEVTEHLMPDSHCKAQLKYFIQHFFCKNKASSWSLLGEKSLPSPGISAALPRFTDGFLNHYG
nr:uncharacterized protein LOC110365618 isoform X3 [Columba livia]